MLDKWGREMYPLAEGPLSFQWTSFTRSPHPSIVFAPITIPSLVPFYFTLFYLFIFLYFDLQKFCYFFSSGPCGRNTRDPNHFLPKRHLDFYSKIGTLKESRERNRASGHLLSYLQLRSQ